MVEREREERVYAWQKYINISIEQLLLSCCQVSESIVTCFIASHVDFNQPNWLNASIVVGMGWGTILMQSIKLHELLAKRFDYKHNNPNIPAILGMYTQTKFLFGEFWRCPNTLIITHSTTDKRSCIIDVAKRWQQQLPTHRAASVAFGLCDTRRTPNSLTSNIRFDIRLSFNTLIIR